MRAVRMNAGITAILPGGPAILWGLVLESTHHNRTRVMTHIARMAEHATTVILGNSATIE